jgi:hypothetical protein
VSVLICEKKKIFFAAVYQLIKPITASCVYEYCFYFVDVISNIVANATPKLLTLILQGYVRKPNPARELVPEKPLPSLGPKNYRTCPFSGESGAVPECPRMGAILQNSRQPTASALTVNNDAVKLLKSTQELFKQT